MDSSKQGKPYQQFADRGVWIHSLGPHSPVPGKALHLAIYDAAGELVREMREVNGRVIDPGYVDFFGSSLCRPMKCDKDVVDIDPATGDRSVLATNLSPHGLRPLVDTWSTEHGVQA